MPALGELVPVVRRGSAWVRAQRCRHRLGGRVLTAAEKAAYAPFLTATLLASVRLAVMDPLPLPPRRHGFPALAGLFAQQGVQAITLYDTVILSRRFMPAPEEVDVVLFHELVHVEQFHRLGLGGFVGAYLGGWLAARDYEAIPLEAEAYARERQYRAARRNPGQLQTAAST